jgi:hypothetical protein
MNQTIKDLVHEIGTDVSGKWMGIDNVENLVRLVVERILDKMETEIELAYTQDQTWTASTLEALALEILDDFDMDLSNEQE